VILNELLYSRRPIKSVLKFVVIGVQRRSGDSNYGASADRTTSRT